MTTIIWTVVAAMIGGGVGGALTQWFIAKLRRDYFAAQALAGHLASLNPGSWGNDVALASDAAKGAYLVADEMMKARNV